MKRLSIKKIKKKAQWVGHMVNQKSNKTQPWVVTDDKNHASKQMGVGQGYAIYNKLYQQWTRKFYVWMNNYMKIQVKTRNR